MNDPTERPHGEHPVWGPCECDECAEWDAQSGVWWPADWISRLPERCRKLVNNLNSKENSDGIHYRP